MLVFVFTFRCDASIRRAEVPVCRVNLFRGSVVVDDIARAVASAPISPTSLAAIFAVRDHYRSGSPTHGFLARSRLGIRTRRQHFYSSCYRVYAWVGRWSQEEG